MKIGTVGSIVEWISDKRVPAINIDIGTVVSGRIDDVDHKNKRYTVTIPYGRIYIPWEGSEVTAGVEEEYPNHFTEEELERFKGCSFNFPHMVVDEHNKVVRVEEIVALGGGGKGDLKGAITSIGVQVHEKGKPTVHRHYKLDQILEETKKVKKKYKPVTDVKDILKLASALVVLMIVYFIVKEVFNHLIR